MIRVLLAEDHAMLRGVRAALLALEGDIEIVAEVSRGDEVVAMAYATNPEVALLSIDMHGCNGIVAAAALHEELPSCRIFILTTFGHTSHPQQMIESGIVDFLFNDIPSAQLATAIRRAVAAFSEGCKPLTRRGHNKC